MVKQLTTWFFIAMAIVFMSCDDDGPAGPDNTPPATPVISSVTPDTSTLTVVWNEISGATGYKLYWDTTTGVSTSSAPFDNITVSQFEHTGLANGVTYYYKVAAKGSGGVESGLSGEKSGTPIPKVIQTPQNFSAVPDNEEVSLSWDVSTGASTYTIYWDTKAGVTDTSNAIENITSLVHKHTSLTNGTAHFYRIAAKDATGGSSDLSAEISSTPINPVPTPQNLTATPGNTFILLSIDKYNGKNAKFRIYWDTTAGVTTASDTIVDPTGKGIVFPHTITGLTNGTTYHYRAVADSSGVVSGLSNEASATPSDTIGIGIPQGVKATKGNAQVTLSWNAVIGAATYNIYWASNPGVTTGSDSVTGITKAAYDHTGLTNFIPYYYKVNAVDASGDVSGLSVEVSATPDTSGSGNGPQNVVATPGSGQIIITWDPVNGGVSYSVYGDTSPGITETSPIVVSKLPEGTSSFTHTPVPAGTTYYYKVSVYIKEGANYNQYLSKEVSATPTK